MAILSNFFRNAMLRMMCMCDPFRISLYWQQGYMWQEVDYEFQQFCMMHSYEGYPGRGKCYYGAWDAGPCRSDAVYIAECNDDPRQQWTFVNLRNEEFQIKTATENQCMERIGYSTIRLRDCDSNNARQRWYTPAGDTSDRRFAISQASTSNLCIGQLHHPKDGEVVEMENCRTSYWSETLYWEKF
jgi:hypothetical protein